MSIKTIQVCQSCGLPMSGEYMFGTHGDGHPCSEYCRNCFQRGFFTAASLDEQQKAIAVSGLKGHADLSNLKRWILLYNRRHGYSTGADMSYFRQSTGTGSPALWP